MMQLVKGTTLNLNKESNSTLTKVRLGAGWDVADGKTVDLDLVLVPVGGDPLYFGCKEIPGAKLDKDDLTGAGSADGADENIEIDIAKLEKDAYFVVINIYDAKTKGQFFKDVGRAFVEVEDLTTKNKLFNYNISENGGDNFTLVAGKLTKKDGGLEFTGMSDFSSKTLDVVVKELGGNA